MYPGTELDSPKANLEDHFAIFYCASVRETSWERKDSSHLVAIVYEGIMEVQEVDEGKSIGNLGVWPWHLFDVFVGFRKEDVVLLCKECSKNKAANDEWPYNEVKEALVRCCHLGYFEAEDVLATEPPS